MLKTDLNAIMDEIAATHEERTAKSRNIARQHLAWCYKVLGLYQPKNMAEDEKKPRGD